MSMVMERTERSTEHSHELESIRARIDDVDRELIELIAKRNELARCTRPVKANEGRPLIDPAREAVVIRRAAETARKNGLDEEAVRDVFWRLIALARTTQE